MPGGERSPREEASGEGEPAIDVSAPEHEKVGEEAAGDADDFLSLMAHFYRGSLGRATKWRDRLVKDGATIAIGLAIVVFGARRLEGADQA